MMAVLSYLPMKAALTLRPVLAASLLAAGLCAAAPKGGKPGLGVESLPQVSRNMPHVAATSREQVLQRLKDHLPSAATPAGTRKENWNAADHMDIIGHDGAITLVPKGAILHVPERLRASVGAVSGRILPWAEFASSYPSVVEPLAVTLENVSGVVPLSAEALAAVAKSDRIVVALLNGGPVSFPESKNADSPPAAR